MPRRRKTCTVHTGPDRGPLSREPDEPCGLLATHHHEDRGQDVYACRRHADELRGHGYRLRPVTRRESGASVPESQRDTVAVKLRLAPDVAERLRDLAGEDGVSACVTRMVREAG